MKRIACLTFGLMLALNWDGAARADDLRVVNVMPAFLDAWHAGEGRPLDERVQLMKTEVFEPYRDAFDTPQFQLDDVHIAWYLGDVAPLMPIVTRLSGALTQNLALYTKHFKDAFPDFSQQKPIYFLPSMLNFNGQTRNGVLRFGLDGIAKYDGPDADLAVIVTHELFHLYYYQIQDEQRSQPTGAFWERMWSEGIATYVASRLNPTASMSQVLGSSALGGVTPADKKTLACEILPALDSSGRDAIQQFLTAGAAPPDLPDRGGYLIGYSVAAKIGEKRDLRTLATLHGADLHSQIAADVGELCNGTSPAQKG